ncbi:MAG: SDR family oxidoreductase [Desulfobacterales bacterium]|jgi:NAD(P)-dependent dehydrogenase (short-subunit alcohol dehydrogenase family)|nr:SDR family oxidoreductase [Desulfobacterales bacterium]
MSLLDGLFSLKGKVALVTGASSGIGRAMAFALAGAGAAVVSVARGKADLRRAVAEAREAGGQADFLAADVSRIASLPEAVRRAGAIFGPPDILVNAAGVNPRMPWSDVTRAVWDQTLRLNLGVPFFLAKLLVPSMQARGWGRIINIGSLQSVRAFPDGLPYGASKGGVMQLTRAMAEAWSAGQSGITCNAISPGFMRTRLTEPLFKDDKTIRALARQTIIGRNAAPEDVYGLTIFLASPAAGYITGQTIFVDGGWSAK